MGFYCSNVNSYSDPCCDNVWFHTNYFYRKLKTRQPFLEITVKNSGKKPTNLISFASAKKKMM